MIFYINNYLIHPLKECTNPISITIPIGRIC